MGVAVFAGWFRAQSQSQSSRGRAAAILVAVLTAVAVVPGTPATAAANGPERVTTEFVCARHPGPDEATCLAERRTDIPVRKRGEVTAQAAPSGYAPTDLQSAYHIPSAPVTGTPTVALVDAYDDPAAESDLGVYRAQYGLPACTSANGCFRKVSQTGSSSLPRANSGWASEIALDLEMVSAACPACKILLVEATSSSTANLGVAANYAAGQVGTGGAVSNSYGASESSSDPSTG
jgi:subtilase family serine protease